ncbi:MAG: ABC transporter substrate-binding protein [Nocardiopsaceae bacterium]|nr:ABC transporter substrate-binding protein [Nocardiopsaceae bacterium]
MSGNARSRVLVPALALVLLAVLTGCGGLFGLGGTNAAAADPGPLGKTTLNVSVVPALDSAGFFVALKEGLFAKQGLTINYTPATSSDTVINEQVAGKFDITGGNYVSYIQHYISDHQPLEIVAEGSLMQEGTQALYTMPDSKITTLSALRGHVLGINAPGNINYLLAASVLTENGIPLDSVRFPSAPIPFPMMGAALASGKVAAAALPEPFATEIMQKYGAVPLADLNQGATQNFPIQGYVVTRSWAKHNPGTLKAFLAALKQGQKIADTNQAAARKAMESLSGPMAGQVTTAVGATMTLNDYPLGIDPKRLQRVPDVMLQFGLLHKRFNIASMLPGG